MTSEGRPRPSRYIVDIDHLQNLARKLCRGLKGVNLVSNLQCVIVTTITVTIFTITIMSVTNPIPTITITSTILLIMMMITVVAIMMMMMMIIIIIMIITTIIIVIVTTAIVVTVILTTFMIMGTIAIVIFIGNIATYYSYNS